MLVISPGRIRTSDPVVNSHLLCQLSYRGISFIKGIYNKIFDFKVKPLYIIYMIVAHYHLRG